MAVPLTWLTLQATLLSMLAQAPPPYNIIPPDFANQYPQAIGYAEARIARDIIFINTNSQNTSLLTTAGSRTINLSAMTGNPIVVPDGLALITPAGTTNPALGTRVPFDVAKAGCDFIDLIWPQESVTVTPSITDWNPRFWALKDDHTIVIAPTPDNVYTAEITGLFQQPPLTATNTSTYISTTYPELMVAACMIFLSGSLLRNYGAAANDPRQGSSWEGQYQTLLPKALGEEARRRGLSPDEPMPAPSQAGGMMR